MCIALHGRFVGRPKNKADLLDPSRAELNLQCLLETKESTIIILDQIEVILSDRQSSEEEEGQAHLRHILEHWIRINRTLKHFNVIVGILM